MAFDPAFPDSRIESDTCNAAEQTVAEICRTSFGRPELRMDDPIDTACYPPAVLDALAEQLTMEFGVGMAGRLPDGITTVRALSDRIERLVAEEVESLFGTAECDVLDGAAPDSVPRPARLRPVHELIEGWAEAAPDTTALVFEDTRVTYAELARRAHRMAWYLRARGIRRGDIVAVHIARSPLLVTSLLAVLKTGAAFTVLDLDFPVERLDGVLAKAGAAAVLTHGPLPAGLDVAGARVYDLADIESDMGRAAQGGGDGTSGPDDGQVPVLVEPADTACIIFTSGSTGRPKGVLSTHGSLTATLTGQEYAALVPGQVWLQCSPVSWDAFLLELFAPLVSGSTCVLQPGQRPDPQLITELVRRHGVTTLHVSASLLNFLVDEHPDAVTWSTLRHLLTGGEAASTTHIARLMAAAPQLNVVNGYSPVENMIFTLAHRIRPSDTDGAIPVGKALHGKGAYVLDGDLEPVPPQVVGEVYMTGAGLAHGYTDERGLTAERFVPCPFGAPGERMYRTGDVGRWNREGALELLGRSDDQIKIRGHRVEPAGIDAALQRLPGVWRTATVVREDRPGDQRLTSYVVTARDSRPEAADLREALARTLPDYMVPSAIVLLDELPVTPNGKLDRAALPVPPDVPSHGGAPGRTPQEEILRTLFSDVLGVPDVGVDDGFFALGGHSLLVTRLVAKVKRVMNAEIRVRDVFEHPTVAGLARRLRSLERATPPLVARERPAFLPLSPGQKRLWFIDRLEGAADTYNIPVEIALAGELDTDALEAALRDVIERHEALRTVIGEVNGEPCQLIRPVPDVPVMERRRVAPERLDTEVTEASRRVFDLLADHPFRAVLFTAGPTDHTLLLVMHHIAADGLSLRPLIADVTEAYAARTQHRAPAWRPLAVQYADYTLWQHEALGGASDPASLAGSQLAYWRENLADLPDEIPLPADRPRPALPAAYGHEAQVAVDADVHRGLIDTARRENVTLFMIAQAAVAVVLGLNGAGTDIPLGTPVAGRADDALDELIGFFVNTLVLRTDLSGDPTLRDVLGRVRGSALSAYAHQDVPFDRVVDELNPARSAFRHPLFQTAVTFEAQAGESMSLPGLEATMQFPHSDAAAKFDLGFAFVEHRGPDGEPAGLHVHVEYNAHMFDRATTQRLAAAVERVLGSLVERPDARLSELPACSPDEYDLVTRQWNATETEPVPQACIHQLFESQADRTPDATALVFNGRTVTYTQLDEAANRLAHRLIAHGARTGDVVGIGVARGPELISSLMAVLKAGCAYALLDPTHPVQRRRAILAQTGARILIASGPSSDLAGSVDGGDAAWRTIRLDEQAEAARIAGAPATRPQVPTRADDRAAVMFTSGSTGRPKGVVAPHRAIVATHTARSCFDHGPHQGFLQCSPVSWDAFALEVFSALFHGGFCVLQPGQSPDLTLIEELSAAHGVTLLQLSTSLFNAMVDEDSPVFGQVRHVMIGGEVASPTHVARALTRHPGLRITNGYGPVENLGFSTVHDVTLAETAAPSLPIGRPLAHKRAYVLDVHLRPVPPGVAGELYVAGHGLAHGYLGQQAVTAERFVPDPFAAPGGRMYRTGDLACWNTDGVLEFLGRSDNQVKIRGFRVEPSEVESALHRLPGIARAAVTVREIRPGEKRLVAYVVPADGAVPRTEDIRAGLRACLPDYMVPTAVVALDELPLNGNGKVDHAALPAPELLAEPHPGAEAPRTALEQSIADIWAQVLGVARVGPHDNFFALGGDSIGTIRIVSRLRKIGVVVTPKALFEHQTAAELAAAAGQGAQLDAEQGVVSGPVPLTPAQHWFFAQELPAPDHFNQSVVLTVGDAEPQPLGRALDALVAHHDILRSRFVRQRGDERSDGSRGPGAWRQEISAGHPPCRVRYEDLTRLPADHRELRWSELAEEAQAGGDIAAGPLLRALLADCGDAGGRRLLLTIHHLVVDIVSWSIIIDDLVTAYRQTVAGRPIALPPKTTSFPSWARRLHAYAAGPAATAESELWGPACEAPGIGALHRAERPAAAGPARGAAQGMVSGTHELRLGPEVAGVLLHSAHTALGVSHETIVLSALARALCQWSGDEGVVIDVEGHGREQIFDDVDLTRTVGWFTTLHPLHLAVPAHADPVDLVHDVAAHRDLVPHRGIGFGVLAHLTDCGTPPRSHADVAFNFHGRETSDFGNGWSELHGVHAGAASHPDNHPPHALTVDAGFLDDDFTAQIVYRVPARLAHIGREIGERFAAALSDLAGRVRDGDYVKRLTFASISRSDAAKIAERFN